MCVCVCVCVVEGTWGRQTRVCWCITCLHHLGELRSSQRLALRCLPGVQGKTSFVTRFQE